MAEQESMSSMLSKLHKMYKDKMIVKDAEIQKLLWQLNDATSRIENSNKVIKKLRQENKEALHEHTSHIAKTEQQEKELRDQYVTITDLRKQLKTQNKKLTNVLQENQQLKNELNEKKEEIDKVIAQLKNLNESK